MSKVKGEKNSPKNPQLNDIYSGTELLHDIENNLYKYNNSIIKRFAKLVSNSFGTNIHVLDFGAGTGYLASKFRNQTNITPDCFEIDVNLGQEIAAKGFRLFTKYSQPKMKYELIYSSNVLEHIDNDVDTLRSLRNLLTTNGLISIYVPASPLLFSDLDRHVGHFRRYSRKELKRKINEAGLEIQHIRFVDCLGFFASLLIKVLGFRKFGGIGTPRSLRFYDTFVFPLSQILDFLGFNRIIGKNIFLVAKIRE
jgi:SAM-dependent methyltransferase